MDNDLKYIDEFYKANLSGLSEKAGGHVWKKLYWTLLWLRYKWFLLTGLALLLVGFGGYYLFSTDNNIKEVTAVQSQPADSFKNTQKDKNNTFKLSAERTKPAKASNKSEAVKPAITSNRGSKKTTSAVKNYQITKSSKTKFYSSDNVAIKPQSSVSGTQKDVSALGRLQPFAANLSVMAKSDSIKLGDNRRADILPERMKKQRFSVNIFAGAAQSRQTILGNDEEYLKYRNNHEQAKTGWTLGTDIRYHFKNWTIATGINYSTYPTCRNYQYTFDTYDPDNSYFDYDTTWLWVFDAPDIGKPMVKDIDSSWIKVYQTNLIDNSGYNQLSYFEIPLLMGYRFKKNRVVIELNTGISVGFLTSSTYKVPDFNDYHTMVEITQMNKTLFNYIASVSFYYQLDEQLLLLVAPNYKQNLQSVFKKDYPVTEQFKTFGLNLGVSYQF
ncbi:MAG: hypothetical protein DRJ09_08690 [Bacteroidetes bacterium]|nr:MAG: hypothetical protein DRJ09_08690 [Bacteroidota bacterium]